VIVELPSTTTKTYDRELKFPTCQTTENFQEYLLAACIILHASENWRFMQPVNSYDLPLQFTD
jgi:hypothetical protein